VDETGRWLELVERLAEAEAYALDTEFHRERTYFPQLALVQLAWDGGVALVDPLAVDVSLLAKVLEGRGTMVAHASAQDLEILERHCGTGPRRLYDTQVAAGFLGMSSPSLQSLVERLLRRRLAKGDRLTDWTRRPLSAAQRDYAAADVAHLLELRRALDSELGRLGRAAWAEEECERLRSRPRPPAVPEEAWWRIKDARSLRGAQRGVAQEVAAWRERLAMERDVPPRFVLGDLALSAVVQRPPKDVSELAALRGLEGRPLPASLAAGLLEAVARGAELPPQRLRLPPREPPDRPLRPLASMAAAWVSQRAEELSIDANLLGTRADILALLRGDPQARLAHGWRRELVGEALVALRSGRAALAVEGDSIVLEPRHRPGS
jgi:ribonuclease D